LSSFQIGSRPEFTPSTRLNQTETTQTKPIEALPSKETDKGIKTSSEVFGPETTRSMPSLPPIPELGQIAELIEVSPIENMQEMTIEINDLDIRPVQMGEFEPPELAQEMPIQGLPVIEPEIPELAQESDIPQGLPVDELDIPQGLPVDELNIPQGLPVDELDIPQGLPVDEPELPELAQAQNVNDQEAPVHIAPPKPEITDLLSLEVRNAHHDVAQTMLSVGQGLDISAFLSDSLRDSLKELRDSDSGFGRKGKIDTALNNSQASARTLMQTIGSNSDISFVLKGKSTSEITTIVTNALQKSMNYSDRDMAKLSTKKKEWIARTVQGIEAGMVRQPAGPVKGLVAQSLDRLENTSRESFQRLGNLHPLSIQAMGQTTQELQAELSQAMGHNPDEIFKAIGKGLEGAFGKINEDPESGQITGLNHNGTDYNVIKTLGRGQCGEVLLIQGPDPDKKQFALKPLDADPKAVNELQIQIRASSDTSLKIEGVVKQGNQVFAMIELASGGELMNNLDFMQTSLNDNLLSPSDKQKINVRIGIGAAESLSEFHSKGLIHRDIKPQNFFLNESGKTLLGDMGEALPDTEGYTEILGTPDYLAPEVSIQDQKAGQGADNWALGIMLHEMLVGPNPFDSSVPGRKDPSIATVTSLNAVRYANNELLQKIDGSTFTVDFSQYPEPLNQLFEGLLHPDPTQRMTAAQATDLLKGMDDTDFDISKKIEDCRKYGKNQKDIQETIKEVALEKMQEQHPEIPHIDQINRDLARYERAVFVTTDPTERANTLLNQRSLTEEDLDQRLVDALKDRNIWQGHMNDYNQALGGMMSEIMLDPRIVTLTDKTPALIHKFNES
jgi:serine/threonine protein kinase